MLMQHAICAFGLELRMKDFRSFEDKFSKMLRDCESRADLAKKGGGGPPPKVRE